MSTRIVESIKSWFAANKYGLAGFAVGMIVVLAVAGLYRISWEFQDSTPPIPTVNTQTDTKTNAAPAPTTAPKPGATAPQRPTRARPVLQKLDGPPDALRRLHEQQNQGATTAP